MVADPMNLWQKYHVSRSISDALRILADSPGDSQIIAGGTDLLLDLQQGRFPPVGTLVDITRIPEMTVIEMVGEKLFIGAGASHKTINQSRLVQENCAALAIASGLIGGPQVRNTATIGGNVAHALPAADGTIALLSLDAVAEIATLSGKQRVPLLDLFLGPGESTLKKSGAILTGFYVDLKKPGQSSTFRRIMRPQGVAIAILNMAVWLQKEARTIVDIRISVGPSGPIPRRMKLAEDVLRGKALTQGIVSAAQDAILEEASFRTSRHRATKEYRQKMAGVLLEENLKELFQISDFTG